MPAKPARLLTFNPDQYKVTAVPKITTDLPFFSLTQRKKDIPRVIKYHDTDGHGREIHWEVYPNTSPEIGPPGVQAHQVYHLLVKPSVDAARDPATGRIPELIPLGGVRESLRKIGWSAGGHQARQLLKVLTQIAFAGCVADFCLPMGQPGPEGEQSHFVLKGRFSRMSVYAIGERHLTEEELATASYDFDLDDTIYIRLDPLEAKLLEAQDDRFLDNQYLFSVDPAARRWYELVAPKIFGVVKNKGARCDVRYSWYIKRHHTLKRYFERRRVVQQMNQVVDDHIGTGYITRVEYVAIQEPDGKQDFVIRYYPGPAAVESIGRILSNLHPRQHAAQRSQLKVCRSPSYGAGHVRSEPSTPEPAQPLNDEQKALMDELSDKFGVSRDKAEQLVRARPDAVRLQLEFWPFRNTIPRNLAGWIINAIETEYAPPEEYLNAKNRQSLREASERARQDMLREQEAEFLHLQELEERVEKRLQSMT
ncbi:MAG: hypothetical protein ACREDR_20725, partial [Blastocatellia bacterium]